MNQDAKAVLGRPGRGQGGPQPPKTARPSGCPGLSLGPAAPRSPPSRYYQNQGRVPANEAPAAALGCRGQRGRPGSHTWGEDPHPVHPGASAAVPLGEDGRGRSLGPSQPRAPTWKASTCRCLETLSVAPDTKDDPQAKGVLKGPGFPTTNFVSGRGRTQSRKTGPWHRCQAGGPAALGTLRGCAAIPTPSSTARGSPPLKSVPPKHELSIPPMTHGNL